MEQHGAIHLFADPGFQNHYDDVIRNFSSPQLAQFLYVSCG